MLLFFRCSSVWSSFPQWLFTSLGFFSSPFSFHFNPFCLITICLHLSISDIIPGPIIISQRSPHWSAVRRLGAQVLLAAYCLLHMRPHSTHEDQPMVSEETSYPLCAALETHKHLWTTITLRIICNFFAIEKIIHKETTKTSGISRAPSAGLIWLCSSRPWLEQLSPVCSAAELNLFSF